MDPITHVQDAIHNPADPRHFMRLKPVRGRVTARAGGVELARSEAALKLMEAGRDLYDPVWYLPRRDVAMDRLVAVDRTTHCPLKGDTAYFDVRLDDGTVLEGAAWSYVSVLDFDSRLAPLAELIAFDQSRVLVTEIPASLL